MKKNIGLLSILVGFVGLVLLLLALIYTISILPYVGFVMMLVGIVGGIVDERMNKTTPRVQPDEGTPGTRLDKGQLPFSGYMRGPK